jgi:hypothetical protein
VTLVGNGLLDADRLVEKFGPEYQRQLSERLKYLEIAEKE